MAGVYMFTRNSDKVLNTPGLSGNHLSEYSTHGQSKQANPAKAEDANHPLARSTRLRTKAPIRQLQVQAVTFQPWGKPYNPGQNALLSTCGVGDHSVSETTGDDKRKPQRHLPMPQGPVQASAPLPHKNGTENFHGHGNSIRIQCDQTLPGMLGLLCLHLNRTEGPIGIHTSKITVFIPSPCKDGKNRLQMLQENNYLMPTAFVQAC